MINRLCGSYESLKGGQTSEAMVDFTGGANETFKLDKQPRNFFKLMLKAQARQSLMCCSINAKPNEIEAKLENGLIKGHAYTVTSVTKVPCFNILIIWYNSCDEFTIIDKICLSPLSSKTIKIVSI